MMAIRSAVAPEAVGPNALAEAAISREARATARPMSLANDLGGEAEAGASAPIPIYALPLEAVASARPAASALSQARQHGWRVLAAEGGQTQLVDLAVQDCHPLAVRRGPSVDALVRAGNLAEKALPARHEFEPRILEFARLGVSVLWFSCKTGRDRFFTLEPQPREFSTSALLREVSARARRRRSIISQSQGERRVGDLGGGGLVSVG